VASTAERYHETMAAEASTTLPVYRLDVDTYNRIVESGALEGQRVELLDGVLVEMSPQSSAHSTVITRMMRHFAVAPRWWTRVQMPVEVRPDSEPEPDLAVFAEEPPPDRHPSTALLVIEVAVSSQMIDRNVKAVKYATAGILTYWLVDVPARCIEVRTEPESNGYARCTTYGDRDKLPSPLTGVQDVDIATLLTGVSS
jgi:Uma2 family endonuclease